MPTWAQMRRCEALADHQSAEAKLFRRRFHVPYVFFLQLMKVVKDRRWFKAGPFDAAGRAGIPVELKVRRESPLTYSIAWHAIVSLATTVVAVIQCTVQVEMWLVVCLRKRTSHLTYESFNARFKHSNTSRLLQTVTRAKNVFDRT